MKINTKYLKNFIEFGFDTVGLKNLLETMGLEVAEIIDNDGVSTIELESTPNRPDWLSHYGIARDMCAKLPTLKLKEYKNGIDLTKVSDNNFKINIENKEDCYRYSACIIKGIEVGESSEDIKELLKSLDLRPVNSIVDISNIILMAYGHPIHIFDLDKIKGDEIKIRRAKKGERITLLNEKEIELDDGFLIISDDTKPLALAGIMGSADSGVSLKTVNILIESAVFNPVVVRKAARRIGLSTDASFRFERGTDINCTVDILEKTYDMIENLTENNTKPNFFTDKFPVEFTHKRVIMPKIFPSKYSGIDIEYKETESILKRLGFGIDDQNENWEVRVPSFRVDIYGKQDLVEEIVRIYGYDNLKSVLPDVSTAKIKKWDLRNLKKKIGNFLIGNSAFEVINYSFHKEVDNSFFGNPKNNIEIKNPLGTDFSFMRNSIIPGILKNIALNRNQAYRSILFYEFGSIFSLNENEPKQYDMGAVCATGIYKKKDWINKKDVFWDLFLFKGMLSDMFSSVFVDIEYKKTKLSFLCDGTAFDIIVNGKRLGYIGELNKEIGDNYKVGESVFISEFDLKTLSEIKRDFKLKKWTVYPSTKRDFSFYIDANSDYERIKQSIKELKPDNLIAYDLFDIYKGDKNPDGMISMSMSFTYSDEQRTLETNEVNSIHLEFVKKISAKLNLIQR